MCHHCIADQPGKGERKMSPHSWLHNHRPALSLGRGRRHRGRRGAPRAVTPRPGLDVLEDRCLLSFSPAVIYPTGSTLVGVLTADFNGDERLDLAVTSYGSSIVSVRLGNPDSTFGPARSSVTGTGPGGPLAVGDFNEDGKLDLATANTRDIISIDYDVSILLGNGDGSFQPPTSLGRALIYPTAMAVGDVNEDGHLDLGVTTVGSYGGYLGGSTATVLLGH